MKRLRMFDAIIHDFCGPVAHLILTQSSRDLIDGVPVDCLTPELRSIEEIDAWKGLIEADLTAVFEKLKRDFRDLERKPREPLLEV